MLADTSVAGASAASTVEREAAADTSVAEALPSAPERGAPPWSELAIEPGALVKGSFAHLLVARHPATGRCWGIKANAKAEMIANHQVEGTSRLQELSTRWQHQHVMATEPRGAQDARYVYQLVEWCAGSDLFTWLQEIPGCLRSDAGGLDSDGAAHIGSQLASALCYLHRFGVASDEDLVPVLVPCAVEVARLEQAELGLGEAAHVSLEKSPAASRGGQGVGGSAVGRRRRGVAAAGRGGEVLGSVRGRRTAPNILRIGSGAERPRGAVRQNINLIT